MWINLKALTRRIVFNKRFDIADILIVSAIVFSGIFLWNSSNGLHYNMCETDCGETEISIKALNDFREVGFKYNLIENYGDNEKPLLYTHNVNIGNIAYVALDWLGLDDLVSKNMVTLGIFLLGIFYNYKIVKKVSVGSLLPCLVVMFSLVQYWGYLSFSLNSLRAWHYVSIFGLAYHLLSLSRGEKNAVNYLLSIFFGLTSFGCGYDFWIVSITFSLLFIALNKDKGKEASLKFCFVVFLLPLVLRQLQILSILGFDYWVQDLFYTIGIKVPYMGKVLNIPSLEVIDAYYKSVHVLRPPAQPSNSFIQIFDTFLNFLENVTIPRWGAITVFSSFFLFFFALFASITKKCENIYEFKPVERYYVPYFVASIFGLIVLAPFSIHVYIKHEMPLLAPMFIFVRAYIFSMCLTAIFENRSTACKKIGFLLVAVVLVINVHSLHISSNNSKHYLNLGYINELERLDGKISIVGYLNAVGVYNEYDYDIDFAPHMYQKDIDALLNTKGKYLGEYYVGSSKFLIYQPLEAYYFMDNGLNKCDWNDPFYEHVVTLIGILFPIRIRSPWIDKQTVSGNSYVYFGGNASFGHKYDRYRAEISTNQDDATSKNRIPLKLNYNCLSRQLTGMVEPGSYAYGKNIVSIYKISDNGSEELAQQYEFVASNDYEDNNLKSNFNHFRERNLSVEEVGRQFPAGSIVKLNENGIGYIIIDLERLRH